MIAHDSDLIRVAGDAHKIKELTAKELSETELRQAGSIPLLLDVTSNVPEPLILNFEIKDPEAAPFLFTKLKTSASLRKRAIVSSFQMEILKTAKEQLPDVRRIALLRAWVLPGMRRMVWPKIFEVEPWAVATRIGSLNPSRIKWLHARGYKVGAYDNRPSIRAARRMAKLGVDIAMTYRPDAITSTQYAVHST
ncbi:MAG: glycerophosphodiester phosphodiesterase [Patescibacteria group bacterium]|nr:glycerophosphodiester phosphodiesterase [Patescibacteria group bacterium]